MIELINLRTQHPSEVYDVKVDRTNIILGNHVGQGLPRKLSIPAFAKWLEDRIHKDTPARTEMTRLFKLHKKYGKLRLFCWCVPLPCHSQIIKDYLERAINR